jgi:small subunit ribosomal protein S21
MSGDFIPRAEFFVNSFFRHSYYVIFGAHYRNGATSPRSFPSPRLTDADASVLFPGPKTEECLETLLGRPLEVEVRDSIEKAMKILKQKMSKEGILQEIKRRRYHEKPSVKRKRKMREARKRRRREAKRRVSR